jgi:hypothetical protein
MQIEGDDIQAAPKSMLLSSGESSHLESEYIESYDDSKSTLLQSHLAKTTIKHEPMDDSFPALSSERRQDMGNRIKHGEQLQTSDAPENMFVYENSIFKVVDDQEDSFYFVICENTHGTITQMDEKDFLDEGDVHRAVVGRIGIQGLAHAISRVLGSPEPCKHCYILKDSTS